MSFLNRSMDPLESGKWVDHEKRNRRRFYASALRGLSGGQIATIASVYAGPKRLGGKWTILLGYSSRGVSVRTPLEGA
jgi:hypothetical protein